MSQAQEFRLGYQVKNDTGTASREMQKRLIVEEFKEFLDAEQQLLYGFARNSEDCLKELADLVMSATNTLPISTGIWMQQWTVYTKAT